MLVLKGDVAALKRDRDAFGPLVLGKLDAIASTLGTSPTTAPESEGSGLCREVAELKAIEDEKRREREAAAEAVKAKAALRTARAEQIKTLGAVLGAIGAAAALVVGAIAAVGKLVAWLKGWM